jgi:hypothetical protein
MHGKPREQWQQNGTTITDSGAAIHCGSWDQHLTEITSPKKGNVTFASGKSLNVEKVGTVYFEDKDTKSIISLQNYHHVPGLTKEMISLGKLIGEHRIPIYLKKGKVTDAAVLSLLWTRIQNMFEYFSIRLKRRNFHSIGHRFSDNFVVYMLRSHIQKVNG